MPISVVNKVEGVDVTATIEGWFLLGGIIAEESTATTLIFDTRANEEGKYIRAICGGSFTIDGVGRPTGTITSILILSFEPDDLSLDHNFSGSHTAAEIESPIFDVSDLNIDALAFQNAIDALNGGNKAPLLDLFFGTTDGWKFTGNAGPDGFSGTPGEDRLFGLGGNDFLQGAGADDIIKGGNGDDSLLGDGGEDRLFGDAGSDNAEGGLGNDIIQGGADDDLLSGGGGADKVFGGNGADQVWGDAGNDELNGGLGIDILRGGGGNDVFRDPDGTNVQGEAGNDIYFVTAARAGGSASSFDGGDGFDTADFSGHKSTDGAQAGVGISINIFNSGDDIFLVGVEKVIGSKFDDHIAFEFSLESANLDGGGGADLLESSAGNDLLIGGAGNDTLVSDGGNDTLEGGGGGDNMKGGSEADVFRYRALGDSKPIARDLIDDFATGVDSIDLRGIDANTILAGVQAFDFVDTFSGAAGEIRIVSKAGLTVVLGNVDGDLKAEFSIALGGAPALEGDLLLA